METTPPEEMIYQTNVRCRPEHYAPPPSSLSLREEEDVGAAIWPPVEVRRCRFIASDDPPAALPPIRLVGDIRDPDRLLGIALVVEDRGRVPDAASLGREDPLREAPCGVPEARLLQRK